MNKAALILAGCALLAVPLMPRPAAPSVVSGLSRPLTDTEFLEKQAEESRVIALARILRVFEPTASDPGPRLPNDLPLSSLPRTLVEAEPVTFLRGGLDGEVIRLDLGIDAERAHVHFSDKDWGNPFVHLAGQDTLAALLFLRPLDGTWWQPVTGGRTDTDLVVGQSHWSAVTDSIFDVLRKSSLDSSLAHADLVCIAHRDLRMDEARGSEAARAEGAGLVTLRIEEVLAGVAPHRAIQLRTMFGHLPDGVQLVCLKRGRDGIYEPLPFARTVLSTNEVPGEPPILSDARLAEVRDILARVRPPKKSR